MLDPKILDFQVPKFWISQKSGFPGLQTIQKDPATIRRAAWDCFSKVATILMARPAQARFLEIWKSGTRKSGNLGSRKIPKIKNLEIRIRSAQNVGKVWISRKKIILAPFGAISGQFFHGPEKYKKTQNFAYFPWWANGPYSTALGCLTETVCH